MPLSETTSEGSYDVPETFLNLDEIAAPRAVVPKKKHGFIFFPDRRSAQNSSQPSAATPGQDAATIATTTEPSIADSEATAERAERLTSLPRRDSWGNLTTVTERATPRPDTAARTSRIGDRPKRTEERTSRASRVADRESGSADDRLEEKDGVTVDSSIWQSPRKKRYIKILASLYTMGYLIFFSILGTLARVGIQALTTYPGAPITTPVVWANLAGSFIMGFLSEDRKLFLEEHGEKHKARQQYMDMLRERQRQRREERAARQREKDLTQRSTRYSNTAIAPRPFTNPTTARLYPASRVYNSLAPPHFNRSAPSLITVSAVTENQYHDAAEEKKRHNVVKKGIPLYIGLTTGFCGSFTSFSTFMRDCFLALSNSAPSYPTSLNGFASLPAGRNGGFSFLALMAVVLFEPALSLCGLWAGGHLALALDSITPTIPFALSSKILDRLAVLLGFGCWAGAIVMSIMPPDRPFGPASSPGSSWSTESWRGSVLFACVMAPIGCIIRFYASIILNPRVLSFPLGTFTVNILGSALEACFYTLQRTPLSIGVGGGRLGCQLLQGAMDGFCGCLTTVSTWVLELNGLRRRSAWIYGLASIVGGVSVMVVIMGPIRWGKGFEPTACGV